MVLHHSGMISLAIHENSETKSTEKMREEWTNNLKKSKVMGISS